jgi:hypothetical protein
MGCVNERVSIIEPVQDGGVLGLIEVELNSFKGIHIKDIVAIVEWGLLVIERWESHPLEVPAVPLFPTHGQPHAAPLCVIHGFNDTGNLVHESDGPGNVIEDWNLAYLLPWEGDVLEQLHNGMRNILQCPEMNPFVVPELAIGHVTMILYNFANMFRRHVLLPHVNIAPFPLLSVALPLHLNPLLRLDDENLGG